jgi:hypothetical protein
MRRATCFLITAAAFLLLVPSADAIIQLDRGIAGARIGNGKAQVRAALGKPRRAVDRNGEFGRTTTFTYRGGIRVIFLEGRVTLATTTGRGDRTARGIGVGSTERAVKAKVPGVRCQTFEGVRLCQRGAREAGQRGTIFFLEGGKVTRVDVAVLID